MAYGESKGHVSDDFMWLRNVKLVTPIRIESYFLKTLANSLLWDSAVICPSDSLAWLPVACSIVENLIVYIACKMGTEHSGEFQSAGCLKRSNSTCLQRCRWQYWSIFIRLAVVASEITRNSLKIQTYTQLIEFKVTQGHRSWCQSKAHLRLSISH